jgi:hypothetical protein
MGLKGSYLQLGGYYGSSTDNSPKRLTEVNEHALHGYYQNDAASGDNRALYLRMDFKGGGGGDCARFYSLVKSAVDTAQGVHATAQIDTGGSISGLICGMRATLGALAGLTISGGSGYALRVDSDCASAITGMTKQAYVNFAKVGANDFTALADFTGQTTADNTTSMLRYKAGGYTIACVGGFRIYTPDGTFWIPFGTLS